MYKSKILGTGLFLPDKVLTNNDISKMVDTNDQWIVERTGIKQRRIAQLEKGEGPSQMAYHSAKAAIQDAGLTPNDIDLILFSVTVPDMPLPNTASILQEKLGMTNQCACLDVNAACTGWVYAMVMANALIKSGQYAHILVVGTEMTSSFNNWQDRSTCILFGDGSGSVVLGRSAENEESEIFHSVLSSDSTKKDHLKLEAGAAVKPITQEILEKRENFISMNGQEVFKAAVKTMTSHCEEVIQKSGIKLADVDWFIPHQANMRIVEACGKRLGVDPSKVITNVDKYANTSSASIPIAFDEAIKAKKIKRGDTILMAAFGAGLTSGAFIFKY